jgi:hypothetical protein
VSDWITLATTDVAAALNEAELEKYREFIDTEPDPLPGILADVTQEVRGYVATVAPITSSGIPHELKNAALDIVVWRLAKRCGASVDQSRTDAADKARALLERVADGKHGSFSTSSASTWGSDTRINVRA